MKQNFIKKVLMKLTGLTTATPKKYDKSKFMIELNKTRSNATAEKIHTAIKNDTKNKLKMKNGRLNAKKIALATELSDKTVRKHLKALQA